MFGNKERDREIEHLKADLARLQEFLVQVAVNVDVIARASNLQWVPPTNGHYAEKRKA